MLKLFIRLFMHSALFLWLVGCGSEPVDTEDFVARTIPMYQGAGASSAKAEPCLNQDPLRQAFYGDLHVHTALSSDAWNYDVEVRPRDAYAYAFGNSIWLPQKMHKAMPPGKCESIDRSISWPSPIMQNFSAKLGCVRIRIRRATTPKPVSTYENRRRRSTARW